MIDRWDKLSTRERGLVSGAAALFAFIIVLQFILLPLLASHAAASLRADQATRTLDMMTVRGLGTVSGATASTGAAMDADTRRRMIIDAATRRGLDITRVQVSNEGVVTVQIDDTGAEVIFAWLFELRSSLGLEATRATMNDAGAGLVRSSFEFGGAPKG